MLKRRYFLVSNNDLSNVSCLSVQLFSSFFTSVLGPFCLRQILKINPNLCTYIASKCFLDVEATLQLTSLPHSYPFLRSVTPASEVRITMFCDHIDWLNIYHLFLQNIGSKSTNSFAWTCNFPRNYFSILSV